MDTHIGLHLGNVRTRTPTNARVNSRSADAPLLLLLPLLLSWSIAFLDDDDVDGATVNKTKTAV